MPRGDEFPVAFSFAVRFGGAGRDVDASFQEVSGIATELQVESYREGGENRFEHQLPTGVKQGRLVLKRGVATLQSRLAAWCRETLEGGLGVTIKPVQDLEVHLLDSEGGTLRQWSFTQAFPVRWAVDPLGATRNELAIEQIELAYAEATRRV